MFSGAGTVSAETTAVAIHVRADITLTCGCPITRGGLWKAADYAGVARRALALR